MTELHEAAAVDDLEEGVPFRVDVAGRDVVLIRWRDEVFAVRNICPHQVQSFVAGHVHDRIVAGAGVGDVRIARDHPVLVCPWHSWEFSLRSGRCVVDPSHRVRLYATEIRDGRILVDLRRPAVGVTG